MQKKTSIKRFCQVKKIPKIRQKLDPTRIFFFLEM